MAAADPDLAPSTPFAYRLPVLGAIAREWAEGDPDFPLVLILALVCLWGIAIMTWGLPALFLPAVFAAPLMIVVLILISRG